MRQRKDAWPQERIDRMLDMLTAPGWSYQRIADELGVTRGAVSGMVGRLRARTLKGRARPLPKPVAGKRRKPDRTALPDRAARRAKPCAAPSVAPAPDMKPARFADLTPDACRFPIEPDDAPGPDMTCCGGRVAEPRGAGIAASYCAHHLARMVRPAGEAA